MKTLALIVTVAMAGLCAGVPDAGAQSNISSIKSDLVNEAVIRKLYADFVAAWNIHEPRTLAAMWTLDGDHIDPDGRVAKGRNEVEALLTKQHASVFKKTELALTVDGVWFITANVALVDGSYRLSGARDPDGNPLPPRKGHLTSVLLKEQSRWSIAASRLMIPAALPWRNK